MAMPEQSANPTDAAICRLLSAGPLPTADLAARLGTPERTVRHRLYRLRQAGAVVSGMDGRHHLAAAASTAHAAGRLPTLATTVTPVASAEPLPACTAGPSTAPIAPITEASLAHAAPVAPAVADALPGRESPAVGLAGVAILAMTAVWLSAAAGTAITVAIRRRTPAQRAPTAALLPPTRPMGYGFPGDPWGGMPW